MSPSPTPPAAADSPIPWHRRPLAWAVAIVIALVALALVAPVRGAVLGADVAIARALNGMLGQSTALDHAVGSFTSGQGSDAIKLALVALVAVHVFRRRDRAEVVRRAAFWVWVVLIFIIVVYSVQEQFETHLRRESPGKELKGWFDLEREHGIRARVRSNNSFPSGHGTALVFVALMAIGRHHRAGVALGAIAAFSLFWRCVTGAHWVSDIALGSVPLAFLFARLFIDTPLARSELWVRVAVDRLLGLVWKAPGPAPA